MAWRTKFPYHSKITGVQPSRGNGPTSSAPSAVEGRGSEKESNGAGGSHDPSLFGSGPATSDEAPSAESASAGGVPPSDSGGGAPPHESGLAVHDLIKGLDVSFGIEASQLDREAIAAARAHADKGLPHHDREGKIEVEDFLAHRASGVLADWARRARTRIEGAIQVESEAIGKQLVSQEELLLRYRYLLDDLKHSKASLTAAAAADEATAAEIARAPKRRLAYIPLVGFWAFWIFCIILVAADFVANVPVFNELLPSSPQAIDALDKIETNAAANPLTYGQKIFWARFIMHLDASILAFSVILFLVILAHFVGRSLRTLTALHRSEAYVDEELIVRHRHQPLLVAWAGTAGVMMIVAVLFVARGGMASASLGRLERARTAVMETRTQLEQQNDPTRIKELQIRLQDREAIERLLQNRHDYATSITALNWPILLLNLALAICAGLLGYLHHAESLEVDPARASLTRPARDRHSAAIAALQGARGQFCDLQSEIDGRIRRVHHLAESRPLLNAEGKAERLRSVIPLFRAENARARGLDTRSIRAFGPPPEISLNGELQAGFRIPQLFAESRDRNERLRAEFEKLEREREAAEEFAP
jgi:hypothetical protein